MNYLIDTHCHLTDKKIINVSEIVERAREVGVEKIILPSVNVDDCKRAIKIAEKENLYVLAGIHPEDISPDSKLSDLREELIKTVNSSRKIVGIGEIGLEDYKITQPFNSRMAKLDLQEEVFRMQIDLAVELNLPVAIHMREGEKKMTDIIKSLEILPRGQFHCFSGSHDFLSLVLNKGFYVSFAGNITYKSAENLRGLIKKVPLNRLLLETDTPYLTPEPRRGKTNEPANVKIIAEFIAKELEIGTETLIHQTSQNAICLYSLDT